MQIRNQGKTDLEITADHGEHQFPAAERQNPLLDIQHSFSLQPAEDALAAGLLQDALFPRRSTREALAML